MLKSTTLASKYLALTSRCRTENQLNKLHIDIERLFAPLEICSIADLAKVQQLPPQSGRWLDKISSFSPGIFDSPQRFSRQHLSENVLLFQDTNQDATEKSLLVAFCGNGHRLQMPISLFLQCLDAREWDVVLVHKGPKKRPYIRGVEGVSAHLPGVIRFIRVRTSLAPYKRVTTLGTSAGGYAAILAAILMHAARGISICGSPPQAPLGFWLRWKLRQASAGDKPELEFVHGADFERDHAASLSLLSSFGGRVRSIAGVGDHNVLFALLKRGQLAEFLREVLT